MPGDLSRRLTRAERQSCEAVLRWLDSQPLEQTVLFFRALWRDDIARKGRDAVIASFRQRYGERRLFDFLLSLLEAETDDEALALIAAQDARYGRRA